MLLDVTSKAGSSQVSIVIVRSPNEPLPFWVEYDSDLTEAQAPHYVGARWLNYEDGTSHVLWANGFILERFISLDYRVVGNKVIHAKRCWGCSHLVIPEDGGQPNSCELGLKLRLAEPAVAPCESLAPRAAHSTVLALSPRSSHPLEWMKLLLREISRGLTKEEGIFGELDDSLLVTLLTNAAHQTLSGRTEWLAPLARLMESDTSTRECWHCKYWLGHMALHCAVNPEGKAASCNDYLPAERSSKSTRRLVLELLAQVVV